MLLFYILLAGLGLLMVGGIALQVWMRRGEGRADPPGLRSVGIFDGGYEYRAPDEDDDGDLDTSPLGQGALRALGERLQSLGFRVGAPYRKVGRWGLGVSYQRHGVDLVLGPSFDDHWVLEIDDASSGGPPPAEVLPLIASALCSLDRVTVIGWLPRQRYQVEDTAELAASPID